MNETAGSTVHTREFNNLQLGVQAVDRATHHIINPGNVIDYAAFVGAYYSAPRFDTWGGIAVGAVSFGSDGVDGAANRYFGTTSKFGAALDASGDKVKLGWAGYNIWNNNQAHKALLVAVAIPNVINVAATVADRVINRAPHFEVGLNGKKFMRWTVPAVGGNVIGTKIAEDNPIIGNAIKIGSTILGLYGTAKYGKASSLEYIDAVKNGTRRPIFYTIAGKPHPQRKDLAQHYGRTGVMSPEAVASVLAQDTI